MDYKIKLSHIRESCVLTKFPDDAQGFIASQIANNFPNHDKLYIAENDAQIELIKQQ